ISGSLQQPPHPGPPRVPGAAGRHMPKAGIPRDRPLKKQGPKLKWPRPNTRPNPIKQQRANWRRSRAPWAPVEKQRTPHRGKMGVYNQLLKPFMRHLMTNPKIGPGPGVTRTWYQAPGNKNPKTKNVRPLEQDNELFAKKTPGVSTARPKGETRGSLQPYPPGSLILHRRIGDPFDPPAGPPVCRKGPQYPEGTDNAPSLKAGVVAHGSTETRPGESFTGGTGDFPPGRGLSAQAKPGHFKNNNRGPKVFPAQNRLGYHSRKNEISTPDPPASKTVQPPQGCQSLATGSSRLPVDSDSLKPSHTFPMVQGFLLPKPEQRPPSSSMAKEHSQKKASNLSLSPRAKAKSTSWRKKIDKKIRPNRASLPANLGQKDVTVVDVFKPQSQALFDQAPNATDSITLKNTAHRTETADVGKKELLCPEKRP
ncbi:basic salivary proline-rich protein 2-like, partial [Penaeus monodon]|uniref:basic salivary proline-rich protein 2-like n=1 Tax=Penaeus monodon TaxID=6687 RepID=UPI0018A74E09